MRLFACLLAVAAALVLPGCSDPKKDFELICNSPQLSGADAEHDPSERAMKLATFLQKNLKSSQAKSFFQSLAATGGDHGAQLRAEAARYGITSCPLADMK